MNVPTTSTHWALRQLVSDILPRLRALAPGDVESLALRVSFQTHTAACDFALWLHGCRGEGIEIRHEGIVARELILVEPAPGDLPAAAHAHVLEWTVEDGRSIVLQLVLRGAPEPF